MVPTMLRPPKALQSLSGSDCSPYCSLALTLGSFPATSRHPPSHMNVPSPFLPQDLCTCSSFSLNLFLPACSLLESGPP